MSRASEFCYIAESMADGAFLMGLWPLSNLDAGRPPNPLWTRDPERAIRVTANGRAAIAGMIGQPIGFRKVLAR